MGDQNGFLAALVLAQAQSVEIRVLARQGVAIKTIAPFLGFSRNTIRGYLRGEASQTRYSMWATHRGRLDVFSASLRELLDAARSHWIQPTVLLREIQAQGYAGGASRLKSWLALFKRPLHDPAMRFDTWGQQGRDPLEAFVAAIVYSRAALVLARLAMPG
ncbi:hypothetical protein [Pseudomonas sp. Z18(2022)]|uniref:hypothetical protein n=1 Tax=Pseudomonas sp. Z18(2022) TaxID=2983410 RepID=UPI002E8139B6|nr:hypothetical protein [Pseudomonas sp. Z18(2022)]